MILGIGTDIIEIRRIEKAISYNNFLAKFFTTKENNFFIQKKFNSHSIAGNFASKEAVSKALGTGFRNFSPIDIEILRNDDGSPYVILYNGAYNLAEQKNIKTIHLSISHCLDYAVAYAVADGVQNEK